ISFVLGSYDRSKPLTIDPALIYSTFLGGTGYDQAYSIAVDGAGNSFVVGETASFDFPIEEEDPYQPNHDPFPGSDVFVTKLDPTGSLAYSTYLGGYGNDVGTSIAVDGQGDAYLTGYTYSDDYPITPNAYQSDCGCFPLHDDAFLTKL